MIKNNKVLVIIPARGGSKGIVGKNIKPLNGKPLIEYSIEVAKQSQYVDNVVVSTDCEKIENISILLGSDVIKRPDFLAKDDSLVVDSIKYTLENLDEKFDFILLLEPTSPMRTVELIDSCIEKLLIDDVECVATFCETEIPPDRIWKMENDKIKTFLADATPWLPRQKLEKGYQLNGLVYGMKTSIFINRDKGLKILTNHITPIITKKEISIDIDNIIDFKLVELLMKEDK